MNREKQEKSVFSKDGTVCVCVCLSHLRSATAPIRYEPVEVDAINQSCRRKRTKEAGDV